MRIRDPKALGTDLQAWMAREGLSETQLSERIYRENKDLKVTQSWISRIIQGKFRRLTNKVRGVLSYAGIPITEESAPDPAGAEIIDRAVSAVWNGSVPHADLIARLIRVAEDLLQASDHAASETGARARKP